MYGTLKALHIIFVISWFAGLFYLPRLYVYHATTQDKAVSETFKIMEHKLFFYIMTPAMVLSLTMGFILWYGFGFEGNWLNLKVSLVFFLVIYHYFCYKYLVDFRDDKNEKPHKFYRIFNEAPTLLLIAIVFLVVLKPF